MVLYTAKHYLSIDLQLQYVNYVFDSLQLITVCIHLPQKIELYTYPFQMVVK